MGQALLQLGLKTRDRQVTFNWVGWGIVVVLILLWEVLVRTGTLTISYIPAPSGVLEALIESSATGKLWTDVAHTLGIAFLAFATALLIGILVGTALALNRLLWQWSMASVDFLRSVPVIALMPIILLIWGSSNLSEYLAAAYSATWLMVVNTLGGVAGVHERLDEVGRTLRLSRGDAVRKVIVPAGLPSILVGARLAAVSALIAAIVAEMIIHPEGIGWRLIMAQNALDAELLFAYAVVSGLLGYLVNALLVGGVGVAFPGMRHLIQAGGR